MNKFKATTIDTLSKFTVQDWYAYFDNVFKYEKLPSELNIPYEYTSEYFIELNDFLSEDLGNQNKFQQYLVSYYFDLPIIKEMYSKIYTLHWIFANLKIRINTEEFFHQFFKEALLNTFHEGIHLHSSLLSLLIELPNMESFDASSYLYSNSTNIKELSFYRVACRYFIQKCNLSDYLKYVDIISIDKNKDLPKVITESIMDCKDFYGSFKHLFLGFKTFWNHYYETNRIFAMSISDLLNSKYLKNGKSWYDNDIYAILLKSLINSVHYPPPIPDINKVYLTIENSKDLKKSELLSATTFLLKNNTSWKRKIAVDSFGEANINLVSIDNYDKEVSDFYENTYGIKKEHSFVQVSDSGFVDFMTRNCNPEYESIKEYDLKNLRQLQNA